MWWLLVLGTPAFSADIVVDVGDDWCAALTSAAPGDRVLLAAGTHEGACALASVGEATSPVTLGAVDAELGAIVTTDSASVNLLDIDGGWLVVESLELGPTPLNVDAIRWQSGNLLTIRDVKFTDVGGHGVVANTAGSVYAGLTIEDSVFTDVVGGAISVGCLAGEEHCAASGVLIEGNRVAGVSVGAGVVFEVDVAGSIRGNTITGTQGPAIVVGGDALADGTGVEAPDDVAAPAVVVEANHLSGSVESATLRVEGGPVLVRNNLVVAGTGGAVHAVGAGRMDHVHVLGNVLSGGDGAPVVLEGWEETATLSFQNNAVWDPNAPGAGVPSAIGALPWAGNVACSSETSCFENLAGGDPSPRGGGELTDQAVEVADGLLDSDLCGAARVLPSGSGMVLEALGDPLDLTSDLDPRVHCGDADTGTDTGDPDSGDGSGGSGGTGGTGDTDTDLEADEESDLPLVPVSALVAEHGGVSCASVGVAAGWMGMFGLVFVAGRRRE